MNSESSKGRQLTGITGNGKNISYTYDAQGRRTSKTVNGVTTTYTYSGNLLMRQSDGTNTLDFAYDASGTAVGFNYNGTPYIYLRNLQGDVKKIVDKNGVVAVQYTYDAWGNVLDIQDYSGCNLAELNPIRYRGYYWDAETGFYFLQTRYYNPEWRRFINADTLFIAGDDMLNGSNMYAYCNGNPVMNVDPTGMAMSPWTALGQALIIGCFIVAEKIGIGQELLFPSLQGFLETEIFEFAAVIYGEGGTLSTDEQYAIAFSIRNRVEKISYYPNNYHDVLSQKINGNKQYTSYNGNDAFKAAMKYYSGTSSPSSGPKGKMLGCLAIALYVYYYNDSPLYSFWHPDNSLGASAFNTGYFPPYHIKANTPSSWHHDFYIFVG